MISNESQYLSAIEALRTYIRFTISKINKELIKFREENGIDDLPDFLRKIMIVTRHLRKIERYSHYLIDEFQDTSGFQENFKPL